MAQRRFSTASDAGTSLRADPTWLPLGPLLLWTLAEATMPALVPELSRAAYWSMAAAALAGLLASLVLREAASLVTARRAGLAPRDVTLLVFGGVAAAPPAERVRGELAYAGAALLISLALASLALFLYVRIADAATPLMALGVAFALAMLNAIICVANLVPAYPLSGGRVLRAVLLRWSGDARTASRRAALVGLVLGAVVVAAGGWFILDGSPVWGAWGALAGLLVCRAALARWRNPDDGGG